MNITQIKTRLMRKTKKHVVRLLGLRKHVYVLRTNKRVVMGNVVYLSMAASEYHCVHCGQEKQLIGQDLVDIPFLEMYSCPGPN